MKIASNRAVALQYQLKSDNGIVIDASTEAEPLWYIHGKHQLLSKFEANLEGLETGNECNFTLTPKEGYGEHNPQGIVTLAKNELRGQYDLGTIVTLRSGKGHERDARIIAIEKDKVLVDTNHELAGQTLHFQVKVKTVRAATSDELSHGHVHEGAHAHHH